MDPFVEKKLWDFLNLASLALAKIAWVCIDCYRG